MAREPKKYWKATHKCWYVKVAGRHFRLDPDEEKAQTLYHEIMAGKREIKPDALVAELILEFLLWSKKKHKASTHEWYKEHLESFSKHIGRLRLKSLKPFHVEQWVEKAFKTTMAARSATPCGPSCASSTGPGNQAGSPSRPCSAWSARRPPFGTFT